MADRPGPAAAAAILEAAIAARLFPAAVAEVGGRGGVLWRESFGALSFEDGAPLAGTTTIFDLASLTKPIAATSVALDLIGAGRLALDAPVSGFFREWRGRDREPVTVQDLLEHASGLPARLLDSPPRGRREFEHEICRMPLEYAPRRRSVYSDLGFILLGFIAADAGGAALDVLFDAVAARILGPGANLAIGPFVGYHVPSPARALTAVTAPLADDERRGRVLQAEVHDAYAARLGGVAGHAGLFGTAEGVGLFARAILRGLRADTRQASMVPAEILHVATRRSTVPGSSRALGWDTMLPTSSCGTLMSPAAFGHVGFTGTSLWIDPDRDRYYVLLTNRAAGGGALEDMARLRRVFHESLAGF